MRAGTDAGAHRRMMAGAHHVGQRKQRPHRFVRITRAGHAHQSASRQRHPYRLALATVDPVVAKPSAVDALRRDPSEAVRARAVAVDEGRDDKVPLRNASHLGTNLLHDADEFVPDCAEIVRRLTAVVPKVGAAHT